MLPRGEELCIHRAHIRLDRLTPVLPRHALPHRVQADDAAAAQEEAEHLPRQARDGDSEAPVAPPHLEAHHQLVDLRGTETC